MSTNPKNPNLQTYANANQNATAIPPVHTVSYGRPAIQGPASGIIQAQSAVYAESSPVPQYHGARFMQQGSIEDTKIVHTAGIVGEQGQIQQAQSGNFSTATEVRSLQGVAIGQGNRDTQFHPIAPFNTALPPPRAVQQQQQLPRDFIPSNSPPGLHGVIGQERPAPGLGPYSYGSELEMQNQIPQQSAGYLDYFAGRHGFGLNQAAVLSTPAIQTQAPFFGASQGGIHLDQSLIPPNSSLDHHGFGTYRSKPFETTAQRAFPGLPIGFWQQQKSFGYPNSSNGAGVTTNQPAASYSGPFQTSFPPGLPLPSEIQNPRSLAHPSTGVGENPGYTCPVATIQMPFFGPSQPVQQSQNALHSNPSNGVGENSSSEHQPAAAKMPFLGLSQPVQQGQSVNHQNFPSGVGIYQQFASGFPFASHQSEMQTSSYGIQRPFPGPPPGISQPAAQGASYGVVQYPLQQQQRGNQNDSSVAHQPSTAYATNQGSFPGPQLGIPQAQNSNYGNSYYGMDVNYPTAYQTPFSDQLPLPGFEYSEVMRPSPRLSPGIPVLAQEQGSEYSSLQSSSDPSSGHESAGQASEYVQTEAHLSSPSQGGVQQDQSVTHMDSPSSVTQEQQSPPGYSGFPGTPNMPSQATVRRPQGLGIFNEGALGYAPTPRSPIAPQSSPALHHPSAYAVPPTYPTPPFIQVLKNPEAGFHKLSLTLCVLTMVEPSYPSTPPNPLPKQNQHRAYPPPQGGTMSGPMDSLHIIHLSCMPSHSATFLLSTPIPQLMRSQFYENMRKVVSSSHRHLFPLPRGHGGIEASMAIYLLDQNGNPVPGTLRFHYGSIAPKNGVVFGGGNNGEYVNWVQDGMRRRMRSWAAGVRGTEGPEPEMFRVQHEIPWLSVGDVQGLLSSVYRRAEATQNPRSTTPSRAITPPGFASRKQNKREIERIMEGIKTRRQAKGLTVQ